MRCRTSIRRLLTQLISSITVNRSTRYPQPIRDGLEVAEDLTNLKKQNSPFLDFATELEEELLQGKVSVSSDGEVQFASDKAKSKKLLNWHRTIRLFLPEYFPAL